MEWGVIFLLTILGMGSTINENEARIDHLEDQLAVQEKWIRDLEDWNVDQDVIVDDLESMALKLAGQHASSYAAQQLKNEATKDAIEQIIEQLQSDVDDLKAAE